MKTRRTRHDLRYLGSVVFLIVATVTATTGLVSYLWDLNDFVYHQYAAFTLIFVGLVHVYLHWGRLVSYIRWRLGKHSQRRRSPSPTTSERSTQQKAQPAGEVRKDRSLDMPGEGNVAPLSRRDFIGLLLGGLGGLVLGRFLRTEPDLPYEADMGTIYHQWSKPKLLSLLGTIADWGSQPALYKAYTQAKRIPLPPLGDFQGLYTEDAIKRRRSVRNYSNQLMTLDELSRLLYYTGGINTERWGSKLRSAPSAGALYPIEVYLVIHNVGDLNRGLYHYAVKDHALEPLRADDLRGEIVSHGLMQEFLGQANLVLVFTAIFQRLRWKYQERSYRYALIEAGHLGQNAYLAATSMGMGACAVGAFLDDNLNAMLGIDGQNEAAIYTLSVGKV
jgi:SagB-type dehydrogenase family enzyme